MHLLWSEKEKSAGGVISTLDPWMKIWKLCFNPESTDETLKIGLFKFY